MSKREDQRIAALAKKNAAKVVVPKGERAAQVRPHAQAAPRGGGQRDSPPLQGNEEERVLTAARPPEHRPLFVSVELVPLRGSGAGRGLSPDCLSRLSLGNRIPDAHAVAALGRRPPVETGGSSTGFGGPGGGTGRVRRSVADSTPSADCVATRIVSSDVSIASRTWASMLGASISRIARARSRAVSGPIGRPSSPSRSHSNSTCSRLGSCEHAARFAGSSVVPLLVIAATPRARARDTSSPHCR